MQIDINCDLGEGLPNDGELMQHISSCNIACGGHAGTIETIDKTIALALRYGVKIGAHPSFPDKENFGRKLMQIPLNELQESLEGQLQLFMQRLQLQNGKLHHIKPHGALYNAIAKDSKLATIVVRAIKNTVKSVFLYVPFNSEIEKVAKQNSIAVKYEAFIDRNYNNDGSLVARSKEGAVINNKEVALEHLKRIASAHQIKTISGKIIDSRADTFCIHGDNEVAVEILQYINGNL